VADENRVGRVNVEVAYTQDAATTVRTGRTNVEVAYTQNAATTVRTGRTNVEVAYTENSQPTARVTQLSVEVLSTHVNGLTQTSFRGRNDDGSESLATWIAAADTDWRQRPGRNFRVRMLIEGLENFTNGVQLYRSLNGAPFTPVTNSSSVIKSVLSTNYTHADDCTQQLGGGSFSADNNGMVTNVDDGTSDATFFVSSTDESEAEWCLQIVEADVNDSDHIELRTQVESNPFSGGYTSPTVRVDLTPPILRRTLFIE